MEKYWLIILNVKIKKQFFSSHTFFTYLGAESSGSENGPPQWPVNPNEGVTSRPRHANQPFQTLAHPQVPIVYPLTLPGQRIPYFEFHYGDANLLQQAPQAPQALQAPQAPQAEQAPVRPEEEIRFPLNLRGQRSQDFRQQNFNNQRQ